MGWTYVTSSDWRITEQEQRIQETAEWYLSDNEKKNENVPCTLALLFGLKNLGICAKHAVNNELFPVYFNFIKKFQFPNPKPRNYIETIKDGILLAPLREIVKLLYYLKRRGNNQDYLTYQEISDFIFYNNSIAKNPNKINYEKLIDDIIEYRETSNLPNTIASVYEKSGEWIANPLGRSLRELIYILSFCNFISINNSSNKIRFKNFDTYKHCIEDIISYDKFFILNPSWDRASAEKEWLLYLNNDFAEISNYSITYNRAEKITITPEWFETKAEQYADFALESSMLRQQFCDEFGIEQLENLSGLDLLNKIFLNGSKNNLCYTLEYDNENRDKFGSIKGGNAYKYDIFYNENWITGTHNKPIKLSESEAIELGTKIRNSIIEGAKILECNKSNLNMETYKEINEQFNKIPYITKAWILKYYQMIYPEVLPTFYTDSWLDKIINFLGLEPSSSKLEKMGSIALFIKKCKIQNTVFAQICYDYLSDNVMELEEESVANIQTNFERNRILFGAPGTGKSYRLNKERIELLQGSNNFERVTFHPDYSYANFVGTYKPVPLIDENGQETITYKYVPGPFMRLYVKAKKNIKSSEPKKPYLLIIEEINRANVAAVFGDIFQLLDRDENGASEYEIQANEDVRNFLSEELGGAPGEYLHIKIPNNMFIWATMNSADQGVFPMDTAFKRRWNFTYIGINEGEASLPDKEVTIGNGDNKKTILWNDLRNAINDQLSGLKINEDKLLGPYFISPKLFLFDDFNKKFIETFKNKVLMYLFEDAAKQKRASLFSDKIDISKYSSICENFDEKGIGIFCNEIISKINKGNE